MYLPLRLSSLLSFIAVQYAFAQSTASTALPPSLTDIIPDCSISCLQDFVSTNYPSNICPNTQDIDCLCTHNTTSGFTIGEGALQCVASRCNESLIDTRIYNICEGIDNSVPETHQIITATIMSAPASPAPAASSTISSSASVITSPSTSASYTGILTATGHPPPSTSSLNFTSSTLTTQPTPQNTTQSTPVPSKTSSQGLSTAQIAGISVAGVASASFVFGLLTFVCCLRKKRREKRQRDSLPFQVEKLPPRPFSQPSTPPNGSPEAGISLASTNANVAGPSKNEQFVGPEEVRGKRRSFFRNSIKPEEIGVAVSPEIAQEESPASAASHRTADQLLPEKPNYSLFPAPLRLSQQPSGRENFRPESTATEFEEDLDGRRSLVPQFTRPQLTGAKNDRQWAVLHQAPQSRGLPSDPRARMYALERAGASRRPYFPPPPIYDNGNVRLSQDGLASAPGPQLPPQALRYPTSSNPGSNAYPYGLQAPLPPRAPSSSYSQTQSLPPSEGRASGGAQMQSYIGSRRSTSRRLSRRESAESVTSIESNGDEDTTPEQELPGALGTVVESPSKADAENASPIKDIQYPKMPRSASLARQATRPPAPRAARFVKTQNPPLFTSQQLLPRDGRPRDELVADSVSFLRGPSTRTSSPSRSDSPSSLLAKRRGDRAADEMEKGLKIRNDINRPPGSKKWRVVPNEEAEAAKNANSSIRREPVDPMSWRENPKEQGQQKPPWAPKLTPTRRGNDLFLSVD